MLTWLRDNAKIFLIATIVIFVSLIFFRWGMGMGSGPPANPYERAIAKVGGMDILPDEYSRTLQSLSYEYRQAMENSGHPDPDAMLLLMSELMAEEAFDAMIEDRLEARYLEEIGWSDFTVEQAASLLEAQVALQDLQGMSAEEYLDRIIDEQPGLYEQYLYQTYVSGSSIRFPVSAGLSGIVSRSEVDFLILDTQGQISARYVYFNAMPPAPGQEELEEFYHDNPDLFNRPAGSLLRFVTISVVPDGDDIEYALEMIDSLAYATPGTPLTAIRDQISSTFGEDLLLEAGQRTTALAGMFSMNPQVSSYSVLLVDSIHTALIDGESSPGDDTLFLQRWEIPVLPGYQTIRSTMWRVEDQLDALLASEIPVISDTLILAAFGEMMIDEYTPLSGSVSEEMRIFSTDTLWTDSIGPFFYSPSYNEGYPAFTIVKRLAFNPADSLTLSEALDSGFLHENAYASERYDAAHSAAAQALEEMRSGGLNLGTWAAAESIEIYSIPTFTGAQIRQNAITDPTASGGPLYSNDFAVSALTAPEFSVIGPFRTGNGCFLAEILSRQAPPENESMTSMMYAVAERGHGILSQTQILDDLYRIHEVQDLREEWQVYASAIEDSLAALQVEDPVEE